MNMFTKPHFQDADAAREFIENIRWPDGVTCVHCGAVRTAYKTKKTGVYRCGEKECRKDFSVTTGSVMESSHIPLHKWLMGFYLMSASKKGMSAHQLHRSIGVTYKSAWFMAHRIREAMRQGGLIPPMGGDGQIVEADETYFGKTAETYISPKRKGRDEIWVMCDRTLTPGWRMLGRFVEM